MSWLKKILRRRARMEITRPWDTRAERRNHHCGCDKCSKPDGCLCLCKTCTGEWQREISAANKTFHEHLAEYKLAREVMNAQRPREALLARRGPGSPEPDSMDWVMAMGQLAGMNTSYNAECRLTAERYRVMARETTSAQDALRYQKQAEYWEKGGPLADETQALNGATTDSFPGEAGYSSDDDDALAKEALQLLRKAAYPNDLNRYFEHLHQKGLSLKLAATCVDDSYGIFEKWEYSDVPDGGRATKVVVRFWRGSRNLDWQAFLDSGGETKEQASGQTVEQLKKQLELWTDR
jgi:hypothetical protein